MDEDCHSGNVQPRSFSFNDSQSLKTSFEAFSKEYEDCDIWIFNPFDVYFVSRRGDLIKGLYGLENYIKELLFENKTTLPIEKISKVLEAASYYVINLFLEAEWLCLGKGFSSICISVLGTVPTPILTSVTKSYCVKGIVNYNTSLSRKICDVYSLTDSLLEWLLDILSSQEIESNESEKLISINEVSKQYNSRILSLKSLNILLFSYVNNDGVINIQRTKLIGTYLQLFKTLNNTQCDRDILSHVAISIVGLIVVSNTVCDKKDTTIPFFHSLLLAINNSSKIKPDDSSSIFSINAKIFDIGFNVDNDILIADFCKLPLLSNLYIVRGILTFLSNLFQSDLILNDCSVDISETTQCKNPLALMCLCLEILKHKSHSIIRIDVNYAILQGLQVFISCIRVPMFSNDRFYDYLLGLPEIIHRYWISRIRRISNLAVCLWKKLFEVCSSLVKDEQSTVIAKYMDHLIKLSLESFDNNLKLKYIALQIILPYIGISNLLEKEPLIIPHLFSNLVDPSIRGACTSLLVDVFCSVYNELTKSNQQLETDSDSFDIPTITFCCLVYPVIIAILHLKRLILPDSPSGKLHPSVDDTINGRQQRANALANAFRALFKRIDKKCTIELLALSTCFRTCAFFSFLSEQEKENIENGKDYLVHENQYKPKYVLSSVLEAIKSENVHVPCHRIIELQGPYNFPESMCLYNSRLLNRVEFIDLELDGRNLQGIFIYENSSMAPFQPYKLDMYAGTKIFYTPFDRLLKGTMHLYDDVCLNILRVVTATPKTTQHIHHLEMRLILYILQNRIKTSLPSFRQHFIAALKPFVRRLQCLVCSYSDHKDHVDILLWSEYNQSLISNIPTDIEGSKLYCIFLKTFTRTIINTMNPCASDFRNTTALEILLLLYKAFQNATCESINCIGIYSKEILTDLYEGIFTLSNKQQHLIYQIFQCVPSNYLQSALFKDGNNVKIILNREIVSLWSVKTIQYNAGSKALGILLFSTLNNVHKDDRWLHGLILKRLFQIDESCNINKHISLCYIMAFQSQLKRFCDNLGDAINKESLMHVSSPIGFLCLFSDYLALIPARIHCKFVNSFDFHQLFVDSVAYLKKIINHILNFVGKGSNEDVLDNSNFHIDCRGHIVKATNNTNVQVVLQPQQEKHFCFLSTQNFTCCNNVEGSNLVPKYVDNEGNVMRAFVVLCWKTIRESCEVLKSFLQLIFPRNIPGGIPLDTFRHDKDTKATDASLYYDDITEIGHFLIYSLMQCRHFGCVDALSDLLVWISKMLVKMGLYTILKDWIALLLDIIKGTTSDPVLRNCLFTILKDAHKRSEPLALAFSSILKAESDRHERILLPLVMNELCLLTKMDVNTRIQDNGTEMDVRIHALNVLTVIFKTSELRGSNYTHTILSLNACLENMMHDDWSVRNSAALLFTGIIQHLTGNDINDVSSDVLVEHQIPFINNPILSNRFNNILEQVKSIDTECYPNLDPTPIHTPIYQGVAFVLNFLNRVPLYSFNHDALERLLDNISSVLICNNASLRSMAAKILCKHYCESGHLVNKISQATMDMYNNISNSNHVNGTLMFIRECIKHGFDLNSQNCTFEISDFIKAHDHNLKQTTYGRVYRLHDLLSICFHVARFTASIENVVQVGLIHEEIIYSLLGGMGFQNCLTRYLTCNPKLKHNILQCCTTLSLISSNILDPSIYNITRNVLSRVTRIDGISPKNTRVDYLKEKYPRLRNDPLPLIQAIRSLIFSIYFVLLYEFQEMTCAIDSFITTCTRITSELCGRCHFRVLEACLLIIEEAIVAIKWVCFPKAFVFLWELVSNMRCSDAELCIAASSHKLLNTISFIAINLGSANVLLEGIDITKLVNPLFKQHLHNMEFHSELLTSIHLYSFYKMYDHDAFKLGCKLITEASRPSAEFSLRLNLSVLFASIGVPRLDMKKDLQNQPLVSYCIHAFESLIVLLQDDNDQVRNNAAAAVSMVIDSNYTKTQLHPNACLHPLLEHISKVFPLEIILSLYDAINYDDGIYNITNFRIQQAGNDLMDQFDHTPLFTMDLKSDKSLDNIAMAEMDTVFNKEPLNMYAEPLYYMLAIDRIQCKHIMDEKFNTAQVEAILGFLCRNVIRIVKHLNDHCIRHYGITPRFILDSFQAKSIVTGDWPLWKKLLEHYKCLLVWRCM
ncbi:bifunctional THADA-TRM732 [Babesia duncani]|uniref:Bifunctional THADA-TRM732 n=1 Tax=Babesia duncani TaxID=323732 RepID=A0AAD9PML6_9APIC|nr:bifunctional THADA-TRM732 [Babesia duncani]